MKKINIKPLGNNVILKQANAETTTASGIIIPDTAQEKPQKGHVLAVGSGTKDHKMSVKVGDTVLYSKYAGSELNYEGDDYLIVKESDILAIIE
jgi:chaperonin GroES|tara:strand:- start:904 stop:1185 length:282 start_codon:yes stop_codon:yes gene_type:complete